MTRGIRVCVSFLRHGFCAAANWICIFGFDLDRRVFVPRGVALGASCCISKMILAIPQLLVSMLLSDEV